MNTKQRNLLITITVFIIIIIVGAAAYKSLSGSADGVSNLSQADAGTNTADTAEKNADTGSENADMDSENTDQTANSESESSTQNIIPDVAFTDMDGNLVNLSDYFDKPIVLNFWATTCPYCLKEIPEFDAVYAAYKENVHFIMLNVAGFNGETAQMGMDYVSENTYSLPFYFDTEETVMYTYGLSSLPMTIFINEGGAMEAYAQGQCNAETLKKGISMIVE